MRAVLVNTCKILRSRITDCNRVQISWMVIGYSALYNAILRRLACKMPLLQKVEYNKIDIFFSRKFFTWYWGANKYISSKTFKAGSSKISFKCPQFSKVNSMRKLCIEFIENLAHYLTLNSYLLNKPQVMLCNRYALSIATERLTCLNNSRGMQLRTFAKHAVGPRFEPRPRRAPCTRFFLHHPFLPPSGVIGKTKTFK